jgi:hypothetical protein
MFAAPTFLQRVADTFRAFALLEDPDLEARIAREAAMRRAHHRRTPPRAALHHGRRRGAVRPASHVCRSPVPR